MKKISFLLLMIGALVMVSSMVSAANIEVQVASGKEDSDYGHTSIGIENSSGTGGILSFYETNVNLSRVAYGYSSQDGGNNWGEVSTTYDWNGLNNPASLTLGDDQVSGAVNIGFNFTFYGNTYNQVYVSSNGFITFTNTANSGCCEGQSLPDATAPSNLVAGYWEDLNPAASGTIKYETQGTAPNRKFIVEFSGVPHYGTTIKNSFQIVLREFS